MLLPFLLEHGSLNRVNVFPHRGLHEAIDGEAMQRVWMHDRLFAWAIK